MKYLYTSVIELSKTITYTYVKIGGSFITYKNKPFSINYNALEKLTNILHRVVDRNIILGNGGGSFAHTVVNMYREYDPRTLLIHCQNSTRRLNAFIVNYLVEHGLNVIGLQTSAIIYEENGEYVVNTKPLEFILGNKAFPIVYGECIFSNTSVYRIVSTEEVFKIISKYFKPSHIVILIDYDGVYTCDPSECSDAELITRIDNNNLDEILNKLSKTISRDATRSIYGKVEETSRLSRELGVRIYIVSGFNINNVVKAILGEEDVYGTIIEIN